MRARIVFLFAFALVSASFAGVSADARTTAQGAPAAPATVPGDPLFVVSGRGYGHGVGMSQFGAYGMANAGYAYDKILAYYYPGTQLGQTTKASVRVLLEEGRKAVTISSAVPYSVVDATGTAYRIQQGPSSSAPTSRSPTPRGRSRRRARSSYGPAREHRSRSTGARIAASSRSPSRARSFG